MALSGPGLSALIKSNLQARGFVNTQGNDLQNFCDDLAFAIVSHITTNAVILPTLLVAPGGSGGPVTGTGKIT